MRKKALMNYTTGIKWQLSFSTSKYKIILTASGHKGGMVKPQMLKTLEKKFL